MNDKKKPWRESEPVSGIQIANAIHELTGTIESPPKPGVNYEKPKPKSYEPEPIAAKPIEVVAGYSAEFLDKVAGSLLHGDSSGLSNRNAAFIAAVTARSLFDLNKRLKKLESELGN